MNVAIDISGKLTADIQAVVNDLEGDGRAALNHAMGVAVQEVTRDHLMGLAATRHDTAHRLGATPTNFLAQAAEKVAEPGAVTSVVDAAVLTIDHPGMIRAFQDVTIFGSPWLTIPLNAAAYGHRAREFDQVRLIPGGGGGVPKEDRKKHAPVDDNIPAYLLIHSVDQPQDRSLLPADEEWEEAAADGATGLITMVMQKRLGLL